MTGLILHSQNITCERVHEAIIITVRAMSVLSAAQRLVEYQDGSSPPERSSNDSVSASKLGFEAVHYIIQRIW